MEFAGERGPNISLQLVKLYMAQPDQHHKMGDLGKEFRGNEGNEEHMGRGHVNEATCES